MSEEEKRAWAVVATELNKKAEEEREREEMAGDFDNYPPYGPFGSREKRNPIPTREIHSELNGPRSNLAELWTEAQIQLWSEF